MERANQKVANQTRAWKLSLKVRPTSTEDRPFLYPVSRKRHFIVCHARHVVTPTGRTPLETLKKKYPGEIMSFGGQICARAHGQKDKAGNLGTPWSEKLWLYKSEVNHLQHAGGLTSCMSFGYTLGTETPSRGQLAARLQSLLEASMKPPEVQIRSVTSFSTRDRVSHQSD